jgi:branched-chain amino acid transport system substrate-binding protein
MGERSKGKDKGKAKKAVKAAKPDIILNAGHLQDAILVNKGLKEQNVIAKLYGYSVGPDTPDFVGTLGKDAEDVVGGAQWSEAVTYRGVPGFYRTAKEYADAFDKQFHHRPDYHDAESTATCLAFQYALEKAGTLDKEKVRETLAGLDLVTFFGLIKFDSRGLNVYKPMVANQIEGGKLVTVWPPAIAKAKLKYPARPWSAR